MEDDNGKTIVQAVIDALVDRELEGDNRANERRERKGLTPHPNRTREDVLDSVMFEAIIPFAEDLLGVDRVDEIMDEAIERKRELEKAAVGPPRPPELL